jgi:phosphoglycerate dehydrogenase-like enzyme
MIGEKELRLMRPSSYLINTARGALIDHQALCRALKEGWIAGAALDIYDAEPIDLSHSLLQLDNITFTPHIAGASKETAIRAADGIAEGIAKFIKNFGHHR